MWTPTALASEAYPARGSIWRVVEHQYSAATRKLVSSHAEQALLEGLLEESKPPYPAKSSHLHYLLKSPFRYHPPRPQGSRFRRPGVTEGVFYGSVEKRTAMAEMAYYRLRFFQDAPTCRLPIQEQKLTAFTVQYKTLCEINLQRPPLNRDRSQWTDPQDYHATQALAEQARLGGIESIRYLSVRDPERGSNIALLTFNAFSYTRPEQQQTWYMHLSANEIVATRASQLDGIEEFVFEQTQLINATESLPALPA